jgi:GH15 family glucan-1,4-alpha-glucosidase
MPRDLPIGNGSLLVNFDLAYNLRDLYFPHVGQENQTGGRPSRVGLWVDGRFTWLSDDGWRREMRYEPDTLVSHVCCTHGGLGLVELIL